MAGSLASFVLEVAWDEGMKAVSSLVGNSALSGVYGC